jgi:hypothetical protein
VLEYEGEVKSIQMGLRIDYKIFQVSSYSIRVVHMSPIPVEIDRYSSVPFNIDQD